MLLVMKVRPCTLGFQVVWKEALWQVERGSVEEGQRLGPEPLLHKHSQVADRAETELAEPSVEEQNLGEDRGRDLSLQEDDQEEGRSLEV